jgi:L-asparagine transporter-like permease
VFGFINQKHQTPWAGLLILAAIPPALLIPYLVNTSANHAIGDIISADGMIGLFMYFVIACASVWFYRDHLQHSPSKFLLLGLLPLLGGLFMGAVFGYGLTTQAHIVSWVSAIIIVVVFALGFIIYAVRPSSPYFLEMKERRRQGVKGTDEVTAAAGD